MTTTSQAIKSILARAKRYDVEHKGYEGWEINEWEHGELFKVDEVEPLLHELAAQVSKRDELIAQALEALGKYRNMSASVQNLDMVARDTIAAITAQLEKLNGGGES